MAHGESLYEIVNDLPELESPVLVHWFDGFIDAGSAAGGLVEHILNTRGSEVIAKFDSDLLVDYRSRRPPMMFSDGSYQSFTEPEIVLRLVRDVGGSPFLLLTGVEPDVQWERFISAVTELIDQLGVRLTIGIHAIPNAVPHTRPIGVIAHATREGLLPSESLLDANIEVPASVSALLSYRLGQSGRDAAGFVARVPHYLSESTYPAASMALLRSLASATGLLLPADQLVDRARRADEMVREQVEENEQVAKVVRALESQYDAFAGGASRGNLMAQQQAIPDADEIGAELEQFLSDLQSLDDADSLDADGSESGDGDGKAGAS
jgi:proteasome assembly chaperone (PAC2) family protein